MPWARIGASGGDGKAYESEWGTLTRRMGLAYVRFICGAPPKGCKFVLHWFNICDTRQHEVALFWDPRLTNRIPRAYIFRCMEALAHFDCSIPWRKLRKDQVWPSVNIPAPKEIVNHLEIDNADILARKKRLVRGSPRGNSHSVNKVGKR